MVVKNTFGQHPLPLPRYPKNYGRAKHGSLTRGSGSGW